jgi:hypothetical protein
VQGIIFKKIIHTIYGEVNNVFKRAWERGWGGGGGGEKNKTEICKMAASRFVKVTDKEISELKINSVPKNTKDLCKNTQTIIRLRLGDYQGIFTLTSSR